jgi:hypothetical protein
MKAVPLFLAVAACQSAAAPADTAGTAAACGVTVRFGSYAMGIDGGAAAAVDRLLAESREVKGVTRSAAGREGEYVLCVSTRDAASANRLFERIVAVLPSKPRGPINVESANRQADAPRR